MKSASTLLAALFGALLCSAVAAEDAIRPEDARTEAAIRELVRRGAVVKRFEVLESKTVGLLVRLKAEHLDRQGRIDSDILSALHPLHELAIELRGLPFSDEGLKPLLANTSLVGLDMSGSEISDRGLGELSAARPRLRLLDLSFTRVGDEGLKSVAAVSELRHLSLIGSRVTDGGSETLGRLVELRELYFAKTAVSSEAVKRLQRRLPKCRIER